MPTFSKGSKKVALIWSCDRANIRRRFVVTHTKSQKTLSVTRKTLSVRFQPSSKSSFAPSFRDALVKAVARFYFVSPANIPYRQYDAYFSEALNLTYLASDYYDKTAILRALPAQHIDRTIIEVLPRFLTKYVLPSVYQEGAIAGITRPTAFVFTLTNPHQALKYLAEGLASPDPFTTRTCNASGYVIRDHLEGTPKRTISSLDPDELAQYYFHTTAILDLMMLPIQPKAAPAPQAVPPYLRFEHTHILGPSGSGKTTLLRHIILNDFYDFSAKQFREDTAYVIIDPKGDLFDSLSRLVYFSPHNSWNERLVIIDPLDHPALNVFASSDRNVAQIVSSFSYIFSTTRQQLTGKQDTCFGFAVGLLFKMPHADLFTLLDLLDDRTAKDKPADPRFAEAVRNLTAPNEQAIRRFFEVDFYTPTYASTRQEIKTRIWEVLKDEHLFAMLNAPERKIDIAQCIAEKKIVLVNTRMATLKVGHQTLGRYILALAVDALQSRADIPKSQWHPTYIVMDEFQEFADAIKVPEMLRLIRAYNGGAVLAHHNMYCNEFDDAIRSAISTNTSIKYASSPRGLDVHYVARDMQCDPEFLTKTCVKNATHARFGCYFTGLQHPFLQEVAFNEYDRWPKMTPEQYQAMRAAHRARYRAAPIQQPVAAPIVTPVVTEEPTEERPSTPSGKRLW